MNMTTWTNEAIGAVLSGERVIPGLVRESYGVDDHGITGGPVLRGPWGSIGLLNNEQNWQRLGEEARRLNAAHVHGQLVAGRRACENLGACAVNHGCCQRCGGSANATPEPLAEMAETLRRKADEENQRGA
jgi:hypothetical protein